MRPRQVRYQAALRTDFIQSTPDRKRGFTHADVPLFLPPPRARYGLPGPACRNSAQRSGTTRCTLTIVATMPPGACFRSRNGLGFPMSDVGSR